MIALFSSLVFVGTFLAASLAVLLAWTYLQGRSRSSQPAHEGNLRLLLPDDEPSGLLKDQPLSTISVWDGLLARFQVMDVLGQRLAQAGLRWSVGRLTAMMLFCGAFTLVATMQFTWLTGLLGFCLGIGATMLPYWYVLRKRQRRFRKLEDYFPDALDSLCRALCAGHAFSAALEIMSNEENPPLSTELRRTFDEWKHGVSWEAALENLARRVPLLSVRLFVAAVVLQTRTGGKLNETMANLAETIRDRAALTGEVRAIAAHGKLTGTVLTIIPLIIAAMMMVANPDYLPILWHHPWGKNMLLAAAACLFLAQVVISRIVDIKI